MATSSGSGSRKFHPNEAISLEIRGKRLVVGFQPLNDTAQWQLKSSERHRTRQFESGLGGRFNNANQWLELDIPLELVDSLLMELALSGEPTILRRRS